LNFVDINIVFCNGLASQDGNFQNNYFNSATRNPWFSSFLINIHTLFRKSW